MRTLTGFCVAALISSEAILAGGCSRATPAGPARSFSLEEATDEGKLIGYAYDYEQATMLRRPSPLAPPLPGETIEY